MAFSTKSATGIRTLHSTNSCCQPNNQKPSAGDRLHLRLPPPRTPSTPLIHHLHLNHQKPTPPDSESTLASPSRRPTRRKITAGGSTSDILRLFHSLGLPLQPDLYVSLIKECTTQRDSASALRLHAHFTHPTTGALKQPSALLPVLLNRLLLMHVSCGHLQIARQLFDEMPPLDRHAISWAILVSAYSHNAHYDESILLFLQMLRDDDNNHRQQLLQFPRVAMLSVLKACMYTDNHGLGKQLHGLLLKLSPTFADDLGASLADFYGNFDQSVRASKIETDYKEGRFAEVMEEFSQMGSAGISCRDGVLCTVMRACGKMDDGGSTAGQVHAYCIKQGGLNSNGKVGIQCGLIEMYGGCGLVRDSEHVFETTVSDKKRCDALWNAMLMCYLGNGFYVEAFKLLYRMKAAAVEVTESLVNRVRIACGTGSTKHFSSR